MTQRCGRVKILGCCKRDSICLKLLILIFVCSLLCLTCFLIENQRNDPNHRQNRNFKTAQKLIQIKAKPRNIEISNELEVEEGSGYDMPNVKLDLQAPSEENSIANSIENVNTDNVNRVLVDTSNQEMSAASNCISKSDGTFRSPQNVDVTVVENYDYRDLAEDVERLFEFPVFSETQAQDVLLDCNTLREMEIAAENLRDQRENEDQWDNKVNEKSIFLPDIQHENEAIFQLTPIIEDTGINNWDSEDRFFPDEYAFQMEPSTEISSAEFISEYQNDEDTFNNNIIKEVPIQNVDIPAIIDTFLGRISTFLVPPMHTVQSYQDLGHLANFRDNKLSEEHLKPASSKISPVWRMLPTTSNKFQRKTFRPTISPNTYTHSRRNSYNNDRNYERFFQQLFGIKASK